MQQSILEKLTALPFNHLGEEELVRKFRNTYLMFKSGENTTPKVVFFLNWENPYIYLRDADGVEFRVDVTGSCDLYAAFPRAGVFTSGDTFYFGSRIPARQYSRGITQDNFKIIDPLRALVFGASGHKELSVKLLEDAFAPTFFDLNTACAILSDTTQLGLALNSNFAISLAPSSDDYYLLWYLDAVIGKVHHSTKRIEILASIFNQEVQDYIKREKLEQWNLQ